MTLFLCNSCPLRQAWASVRVTTDDHFILARVEDAIAPEKFGPWQTLHIGHQRAVISCTGVC